MKDFLSFLSLVSSFFTLFFICLWYYYNHRERRVYQDILRLMKKDMVDVIERYKREHALLVFQRMQDMGVEVTDNSDFNGVRYKDVKGNGDING